MKASRIIIIAFCIFIVGGMLILYIDAWQHKKKTDNSITKKEYVLPSFNVVEAEQGADLHLGYSDSNKITVEYIKEKKIPAKLYTVSHDTLHVYKGLRLFAGCKNIRSIIGHKAFWMEISNFEPDSLTIKITGGRIIYSNNFSKAKKRISKNINVGVFATDSAYIELNNLNINRLNVRLNNAEVNSNSRLNRLQAKLVNHADLRLNAKQLLDSKIEKDTLSKISFWD
jgi:hypothetical protein